MNHNLSIEISDNLNPMVLRVFDTSQYFSDEDVDNYLLEVLGVNKNSWVTFKVKKGFSLPLNSSSLKYKVVGSKVLLLELPDGIYEFKQSTKPNIQTVKQYYHLRITQLRRRLQIEYLRLIENKCNLSNIDYATDKNKLRDIDEFINAAKWMVEECNDKIRGKELYEYTQKLLEEYTNGCKCKK